MQHTDKARAEFERYKDRVARAMINGGEGKRVPQILSRLSFDDFEAGWQASRASVVVELPQPYIGDFLVQQDCRAAIEAAGLTVKE